MTYINYIDNDKKEVIRSLKSKYHNEAIIPDGFLYLNKIGHEYSEELFNCNFLIYKPSDLSIVLEEKESGIKVYMTDFDIICTLISILDEHDEQANEIIKGMLDLMNKEIHAEFNFSIMDQKFSIPSVVNLNYEQKIIVLGEVTITINDFIVLLNLIIEKESTSTEPDNLGRTIRKYIVFSKLFSKNTSEADKLQLYKIISDLPYYTTINKYEEFINKSRPKKYLISFSVFNEYYI